MKCSKCGKEYHDSYPECPKCEKQPQEELKKCPFCAELIKAEAIKCRHCKSDRLLPEREEEFASELGKPDVTGKEVEDDSTDETEEIKNKEKIETKPPVYPSPQPASKRIARWWKYPKVRIGAYLAACVVVVIIVALIVVAVTHQTPGEAATSKAVAEAKVFLKYASDKKYEALLPYIDKSSYPLLKAELCQGLFEGTPADLLGMDDATFEKMLVDTTLPSLFQNSFWKSAPEIIDGKGVANGTYAVIVKKPGKSKEGGTIIVKTQDKNSYTIDLSGTPSLLGSVNAGKDNRNAAAYITDSVNELLANPTKESCLTAITWLAASKDLESKYGLLVSDNYRKLVDTTKAKMDATKGYWEKAKNLAAKFPKLAEKAEKEMDNFRTVDDYISVTGVSEGQQYTAGIPISAKGTVKDDCTIAFNGQPVGVDSKIKEFAPSAVIIEGPNKLSFVVTNKRGKVYNKEITVIGIPPAPSPPSAVTTPLPPTPTPSTTVTTSSPEYKCACIDAGHEVELTDPLVTNFKYVFDSLQSKFPSNTRIDISDTVCAAKERIDTTTTAQKSLLEVAHGIDNNSSLSSSLDEVAALYIGMVRNGTQ